jgi:hypothetical protein
MSFIVQISPFVHLFTLKIVFRWEPEPPPGLCPGHDGGLKRPPDPSPQVVPPFHFIPSYAPDTYTRVFILVKKTYLCRIVVKMIQKVSF